MSDARSGTPGAGRGGGTRASRSGDIQASVSRLERAVDELVTVAREQVSERATSLLDETAERLERELDRRGSRHQARARVHRLHGLHGMHGLHRLHRRHRASERESACSSEGPGTRPRRLYRDPRRVKIGGVCAGIARYYGMEPWVVRCIAVTALLFFPTIVFPAYWIAYFVMDKPPKTNAAREPDPARHGRNDHRSPTPEFGPRFSPRYSLRNVEADLTEVELRLRRMETHVTSGQYELQRELNKIDGGSDGRRG